MNWKSYPGDRLIAEHDSGFYIIKPSSQTAASPLFCELCKSLMISQYDEASHQKFNCCDKCASTWAYKNAEKWASGWRPSLDEIEKSVMSRSSVL